MVCWLSARSTDHKISGSIPTTSTGHRLVENGHWLVGTGHWLGLDISGLHKHYYTVKINALF